MNTLLIFLILTIINVIFSTIKSIVTIKCNKYAASLVSAGYYGYYNIVLLYTVADFPLYQKILVTFACNLIGVFLVKFFEERIRKDRLWKVEATVPKDEKWEEMMDVLKKIQIPHNYIDIDKYILVNFYCSSQKESKTVKGILDYFSAKYFVSETKEL